VSPDFTASAAAMKSNPASTLLWLLCGAVFLATTVVGSATDDALPALAIARTAKPPVLDGQLTDDAVRQRPFAEFPDLGEDR
jgi:hypothetical protein